MKIFDCTTFFDEKLMMEVRFNILDPYVDKFVVIEANFSHSGKKKKLNFNINDYPKFKNKINYIVIEKEPENIKPIHIDKKGENVSEQRLNSIKRIEYQRNKIIDGIKEASDDDYIIYSDNDEIPKLENFNFNNKSKIISFKQKMYYYKFNLLYPKLNWYGSKACKKKDLLSFSWLRNIKSKKYNLFRFDILFSKNKYNNLYIVEDGGWHFSNLKTARQLEQKYLNDENHVDYEERKIDVSTISDLINRKIINYDHFAKKDSKKKQFNEFKLNTTTLEGMPKYLRDNYKSYIDWFDNLS
tara:strand:+ start:197 stop:1093 length:897 start_codon:yes stop_codon:yes gene_type:complete